MTTLHGAGSLRQPASGAMAMLVARSRCLQPSVVSMAGDPGTDPDLDVKWGPNTLGSDLLYHTQTKRKAFAAYLKGFGSLMRSLP